MSKYYKTEQIVHIELAKDVYLTRSEQKTIVEYSLVVGENVFPISKVVFETVFKDKKLNYPKYTYIKETWVDENYKTHIDTGVVKKL